MAGKTKSTAKVNVKADKIKKTVTHKEKSQNTGVCDAYMSLRNVLDGVQNSSLGYYANGAGNLERIRRAAALDEILRGAYKEIIALSMNDGSGGNCPPGYFSCDGICSPFPC